MRIGRSFYLCVAAAAAAGVSQIAVAQPHLLRRGGDPHAHNLPPAQRLMEPGPGVGGPGPGVIPPAPMYGVAPVPVATAQVYFADPEQMEVRFDVTAPGRFDSVPLVTPARMDFAQGGIYRLKLTNIPGPGYVGVELYPTIEIGPATPRTATFLDHGAIPIQFTAEDFDQALTGNFVTKVIYLPDPDFQELALAGVDTLVSTRLDPGVDPIVEADRRGSILAIIRLGNKDLEGPAGAVAGGMVGVAPAGYEGAAAFDPAMAGPGGAYAGGYCPPTGAAGGYCPPAGPGMGYMAGHPGFGAGPQYGMPYTGTPIGLPGPPHIPLGVPAGLQKHSIHNHTRHHIPGPSPAIKMHVKQSPGLSYPNPADHVFVHEKTHRPDLKFNQPLTDTVHVYGNSAFPGAYSGGEIGGGTAVEGEYCPPGTVAPGVTTTPAP